jgi:hypothetical protein
MQPQHKVWIGAMVFEVWFLIFALYMHSVEGLTANWPTGAAALLLATFFVGLFASAIGSGRRK